MESKTMFFSKTIRAQFFWRRMGKLLATSAWSTLTSSIYLLPTVLKRRKYQWSGALQGTCLKNSKLSHSRGIYFVSLETKSWERPRRATHDQRRPTAMSAKSKQAKTSLRKAKQYVWYRQERKRRHRSVLGVEPGTAVRANPGSWKKISDPQDMVIFNQKKEVIPIFNQSRGKTKKSSLLHLTSTE
jgi:hypothetical protein